MVRASATVALTVMAISAASQDIPKPKTRPSASPPTVSRVVPQQSRATFIIKADVPCTVRIDGEEIGSFSANETRTVQVDPGKHLVSALSKDGNVAWDQVLDATRGQRDVVLIKLGELVEKRGRDAEKRLPPSRVEGAPFDGIPAAKPTGTTRGARPWLGLQIQPLTEDMARTVGLQGARGAIVSDLTAHSPAVTAGFQAGDIILGADVGAGLITFEDNLEVSKSIASRRPGDRIVFSILRDGSPVTLEATMGMFPEDAEPRPAAEESKRAFSELFSDEHLERFFGLKGEASAETVLGMRVAPIPEIANATSQPKRSGLLVVAIITQGAAAEAGVRRGDIIVSANGSPVEDAEELRRLAAAARPEGVMRLRVRRANNHTFLVVRIE